MDGVHAAHLAVLGAWAVVVVVEGALVRGARTLERKRRVAVIHYWIDLLIEIPLLVAVLVTGAWLTSLVWPPSARMSVKIACGLTAVAVNAYCAGHVILRRRRVTDERALLHHGRRVLLSALGVPPALVAAYIGGAPLLFG